MMFGTKRRTAPIPLTISLLTVLLALLYAAAASATASSPHDFTPARGVGKPHFSASLQIRDLNTTSSLNSTLNSTLSQAEALIRAAQEESRERNLRLLASPRRNTYKLRLGGAPSSTLIQDDGLLTVSTHDGTGVNGTVGEALNAVAAASVKNATAGQLLGDVQKRSSFWMENMQQNGASPFAPSGYKVWRNVRDYGAHGDGIHDDTDAINKAISDGNRCGQGCGSSTTLQAVVYFPSGTYLVSRSIVSYYFTQLIGDPTSPPIIKVSPDFVGLGVISSDVYIDGGNGASWYINQNNFYRQVRNFVIDMTAGPANDAIAGIHWQVAQATSLQNIRFKMSTAKDNNQQGIFMENGSGGAMDDLEFIGGSLGAYVGNQQFTVRNLKFSGQLTRALEIHWDWGWTWKGIQIENCPVGVIFAGPDPDALGSAIFIDSSFSNVKTGLRLAAPSKSYGRITLNLFNVAISGVGTMVEYDSGRTLLAGGSKTIKAWGVGKRYDTRNGEASGVWQDGADYAQFPTPVSSLVDGSGKFFARSKPQYEGVSAGQFVNLKAAYGARGDGSADDTQALNKALQETASSGRILWIPAGVYLVSDTVTIPAGAKVVGQSWSQIMGAGSKFADPDSPLPVVKVGNAGDVGSVEIQDLLFTVKGATAGAILLQWNIHESSPGSAAMWDTHIRVGGAAGTGLQSSQCPKLTGSVNKKCIAASLLVHITSKASAYFDNTWFWDLDTSAQTQIDIYVGRGVLVESTSPVWLYGTASEHCVLYQYQFLNAGNVFMGMIQTESPYYQTSPRAPAPFLPSKVFPSDPTFEYCDPASESCAFSWAVRILNSSNMYIYGAGLYSWFQKYGQACVAAENCQDRLFEIEASSSIWIYSLITKASVEMISPRGGVSVLGKDNKISFCSVVMAWMGSASGDGDGGAIHRSPKSATVIPFPATTVKPTQSFTVLGPVVSNIDDTHNDGNQNVPPGPGEASCEKCDLSRLITSTCCGVDGSVSNPVEIGGGVAIPRSLILPPGFVPNQQVTGNDGTVYPAGEGFPHEVIVPIGTIFPVPFIIPAGLPLSNTWSPDADSDGAGNGTLYLIPDFWEGRHTVSCIFPCTIVFPPIPVPVTTWYPPPIKYDDDKSTTTLPPITTEDLGLKRLTVHPTPSVPTPVVKPSPLPKPLCFKLPIIGVKICPPILPPFPPPIPPVTIVPVPPGGKTGPTRDRNEPTEEEQEEEDEEDEEEGETCDLSSGDDPYDDGGDGGGDSYPGAGKDNQPPNYTPPKAGTGSPGTVTAVVTVTEEVTVTVTEDITKTVVVTPTNPYHFTSYDRVRGTEYACQSASTSEWYGVTISDCAGSSTVVATASDAVPTPDPKKWYFYSMQEHSAVCVASRCSHSIDTYTGYAGGPGNPCKQKKEPDSYAQKPNGDYLGGITDNVMVFNEGICSLRKRIICKYLGDKKYECRDDDLNLVSTCKDIRPKGVHLGKYVCDSDFWKAISLTTIFIDPEMECESRDPRLSCD